MTEAALSYPLTLDGFLEWEERQAERFEFLDGVVRLMSGGTEDHDRLSVNLIRLLGNALRGGPCVVHASNLKVLSRRGHASMYPELFVRCGPRDGRRTRVEDPVVVFEVLSDSTARYDLTRKRRAYKAIPSLRAIVYVSQYEPHLDVVRRLADGGWDDDEEVDGLGAELGLPEIGVRLAMAEIYEGTDVAAATAVSS